MDSAGGIIAAVVLAAVLVGGAAVAQLAFVESAPSDTTTDTFDTSGVGSTYAVSTVGEVYFDDETNVTNGSGVGMVEPDDYVWYESNGTLEVQSDRMANEIDASIQYSFSRPTQQQSQLADQLATLFSAGYFLPVVIIVALIILAAGLLGGLS